MNVKQLTGVVRLATRALKMARRIIADAEKVGLDVPTRRRRKVKKEKAAPAKPRGKRTPLKHTEEEGAD